MIHVVTVVGARPQFIKAAAVSRAFKKAAIRETLVHTGQHYDENMSQVFFDELEIPPPNFHLGIAAAQHGAQTGRTLEAIEKVLIDLKPDAVLVYGDTNSTLAGALAASKLHIPVFHVEAGLRSFNRKMPEEINRVVTDHLSSLLFCPTATAIKNLALEGIQGKQVLDVGDVMFDGSLWFGRKSDEKSTIQKKYSLKPSSYILTTIHRAENTDNPPCLEAIVGGLNTLAEKHQIIWPMHPRTRKRIAEQNLRLQKQILVLEPLGYLDMASLEKNAQLVVTDSGGVQKEAFFYGVPCATLRTETEWVELVESGWNTLVKPHSASRISQELQSLIAKPKPAKNAQFHPYGDGHASELIARAIKNYFDKSET